MQDETGPYWLSIRPSSLSYSSVFLIGTGSDLRALDLLLLIIFGGAGPSLTKRLSLSLLSGSESDSLYLSAFLCLLLPDGRAPESDKL